MILILSGKVYEALSFPKPSFYFLSCVINKGQLLLQLEQMSTVLKVPGLNHTGHRLWIPLSLHPAVN